MQIHTPPPPIPELTAEAQAVLDRALLKNPGDRYGSSHEMAIDFYLSIGMTAQAETIREPYPVNTVPLEVHVPTQPESITKQEPTSKPESMPSPEPAPKLQSEAKLEPDAKPEPIPEPTPKPARSRTWIGVGLFSLVALALLAIGAYRFLSAGTISPNPTEPLSLQIPNTSTSPSPSDIPALPEATRMVKVDAGTYEVGRDPADEYHSAPQNISLDEFWIDQYQITNAEYERYVTATGAPTPITWPGEAKHPVRGVSWEQASAYCGWLNKRLPSEAEWEAAGRGPGPEPQLHPWGDDPTDGGNALKLPNQSTYEVGSQFFNVSPLQVYDMVGNVWEWIGEPYSSLPAGVKILRGGRFSNAVDLAYRLPIAPDDTNTVQYAGFRCAADQVR